VRQLVVSRLRGGEPSPVCSQLGTPADSNMPPGRESVAEFILLGTRL
jgi:hypothetical protein